MAFALFLLAYCNGDILSLTNNSNYESLIIDLGMTAD
jgi:hypothetical protein